MGTEYRNLWKDGQLSVSEDGSGRCKNLLALSSDLYLLYLALGDPAELKQTIKYLRQQKLSEWTSMGSGYMPSTEEDLIRDSLRGSVTHPMSENFLFYFLRCFK